MKMKFFIPVRHRSAFCTEDLKALTLEGTVYGPFDDNIKMRETMAKVKAKSDRYYKSTVFIVFDGEIQNAPKEQG